MLQFSLNASIYLDLVIKNLPDYSTIFSNHLAGNMHRYWYAYQSSNFRKKNRYSESWIKRNKNSLFYSLMMVDTF